MKRIFGIFMILLLLFSMLSRPALANEGINDEGIEYDGETETVTEDIPTQPIEKEPSIGEVTSNSASSNNPETDEEAVFFEEASDENDSDESESSDYEDTNIIQDKNSNESDLFDDEKQIPLLTGQSTVISSGDCGDNLIWILTDDGVLTIAGTGTMNTTIDYVPWENDKSSILSVIVKYGVSNIGEYAFANCVNLQQVTIPESITSIKQYAFYSCTSLTAIDFPDGLLNIDAYAFAGCTNITSFNLPASFNNLSETAFLHCANLERIDVSADSEYFTSSYEGVLYNKSMTILVLVPAKYIYGNFFVPSGVKRIESYAFCGQANVNEIAFDSPDTLEQIGAYAFSECTRLTNINIPNGITVLYDYTFYDCSMLDQIMLPEKLISIGNSAFEKCTSLASITIPEEVKSIGDHAFASCVSLKRIRIPAVVSSIGGGAFADCSNLSDIVFKGNAPLSLNAIFQNVTATAYYPENDDTWTDTIMQSYGGNITWTVNQSDAPTIIDSGTCGDNLLWVLSDDGILTISGSGEMYSYYTSSPWNNYIPYISTVIIDNGVQNIGDGAFNNCTYMKEISISESVQNIGYWAFKKCNSLENIIIPEGVVGIHFNAFEECNNLKSIILPSSLENIDENAFFRCQSLEQIIVNENNKYYSSVDGVLFDKMITTLIRYPNGKKEATYFVPSSINCIAPGSFESCTLLNNIIFPDTLTQIGYWAFSDCTGLTSVSIPSGISVLEEGAFCRCSSLKDIYFSDNLVSIEGWVFSECLSLTNIILPEGLKFIGWSTFADSVNLSSVFIPSSVSFIDSAAFWGCSSLEYIVLPSQVMSIEYCTFYECSSLRSITIPSNITNIGDSAFNGCNSLAEIVFEGNAPTFSDTAFSGVTANAYYSVDDDTWTETKMKDYGGKITWVPYGELDVKFTHSCSFENNITLNYYIPAAALEGYENYRLEIKKQVFNSDGSSYTWNSYEITTYTNRTNGGTAYIGFSFSNIAAKEMGDDLHAVLYADKNGTTYKSAVDKYSVKQYAYNRLEKSTDAYFKTLLVDMLNYGAAAQVYFSYNTKHPANAELTAEQQAIGTTTMPELVSIENQIITEGATAKFPGKAIVLGSNVEIKYYMTFDTGAPKNSVKLVLAYTTINGVDHTVTIPASEFIYNSSHEAYSGKLTTIAAKDMSCKVTAKIYDGDTLISDVLEYSIETYAYNRLLKSTDENFKELVRNMMKYGKSAEAYFRNKNN